MAPKEAPAPKRERLDVPAVSELERRLCQATGSPRHDKPAITAVPKSSMLDRLKNFMPQMEQANQSLEQTLQDGASGAFEIPDADEEGEEPYIEMDLACGLYELRDQRALAAAERALAAGASGLDGLDASEASSSDSDGDGEGSSDGGDSEEGGAEGDGTNRAQPPLPPAAAAAPSGAAARSSGEQRPQPSPGGSKGKRRGTPLIQELP